MDYRIIDKGASICISNDVEEKLILKHHIVEISVVKERVIKIAVQNVLKTVFIKASDIKEPIWGTFHELRDLINSMITTCVCCQCDCPDR